ncbi:diguanylate cyclase [Romboutsia maritimum]|uniref:Diguanylate cyclase n=1 Tax=Romboutsia maritimum TaxID=2020948 RepID=A0A255I014_9FIRM|nr:NifB/NifX family molybdenum-iron cluster-binding protein [Romboutsia maritimum]RDY24091.1 diguanylate cyclase [Romboutsia maritimum]
MKIAISATGKNIESLLDARFGRCEYFQIHNSESEEVIVIENKGLTCSGGAGIAAAQQLIDEDVDIIITGNLGPNAFKIIEKAKIKTYRCEDISIQSVLEQFKNNEIEEITLAGPAHNGMSH